MELLEQVKLLTGNTNEPLISLMLEKAKIEVCGYLKRRYCKAFDSLVVDIAVIKLNRMGAEGLVSQSSSGASEAYLNDYPADIMRRLDGFKKKWGMA